MTNPDNIVRVRARNGGRASVYEANGWAQAYTSGLLEGNGVIQNTSADMNVLVGGSASKPDVVLAENPAGYKIALDLVGQQAVAITAPASNSRISAIVAYTDDLSLATTQDTVTGSPASCGLIVVNGTTSGSPVAPTDNQIRTAITADGATGSQAAYCVIATIEVANDTTVITNSLITNNDVVLTGAKLDANVVATANIVDTAVTAAKFDFSTLTIKSGKITAGSSGVDMQLTPGKWLVFGWATVLTAGSDTPTLKLRNGTTVVLEAYCGNENAAVWETMSVFKDITVGSGETWNMYVDKTVQDKRSWWIAIKLG